MWEGGGGDACTCIEKTKVVKRSQIWFGTG